MYEDKLRVLIVLLLFLMVGSAAATYAAMTSDWLGVAFFSFGTGVFVLITLAIAMVDTED